MAGAWQPPVGRLPVVSSPCLRRRRGRSLQCSRCVRVDVDGAGAVPVPEFGPGQRSGEQPAAPPACALLGGARTARIVPDIPQSKSGAMLRHSYSSFCGVILTASIAIALTVPPTRVGLAEEVSLCGNFYGNLHKYMTRACGLNTPEIISLSYSI